MSRPWPLLCCALLLGLPAPGAAQIYTWKDASGTQVFSDHPLNAPTAVYEVEGAPAFRVTRPMASATSRARFEDLVLQHSARHALPAELVRAVIQVESGFDPLARSPKGAMGLMQLMPETARDLGVLNPFDPAQNIGGGTRYLRQLLDKYAGSMELALAAYNAGPGTVDRHGRRIPPYAETRSYVRKVGAAAGTAPPSQRVRVAIYKSIELVGGRVIPRYSSTPPVSGTFERIER